MIAASAQILSCLDSLGISYDLLAHPRVETMADCARIVEPALHAIMPKNLFLAPKAGHPHYLLVASPRAAFRTSSISKQVGSSRLSFGSEADLMHFLHVHPGAISPLGLLFDSSLHVRLLVDHSLRDAPRLAFHPNDATLSVALSHADFFARFLPHLGISPTFVDLPTE